MVTASIQRRQSRRRQELLKVAMAVFGEVVARLILASNVATLLLSREEVVNTKENSIVKTTNLFALTMATAEDDEPVRTNDGNCSGPFVIAPNVSWAGDDGAATLQGLAAKIPSLICDEAPKGFRCRSGQVFRRDNEASGRDQRSVRPTM
jgi:hypothetical protein